MLLVIVRVRLVFLLFTLTVSVFLDSARSTVNPPSAQDSNADSIVLNVTVTDKSGQAVAGLDKTAFTIYDNNVPQEISYFEKTNNPLSVGIILGMHGSKVLLDRREESVETIVKLGLHGFIQASHRDNRYFLHGFYRGVEHLSDWTQDGAAMIDRVGQAKFRGGTLLDACYAGVEKLINEGRRKRVLLVVSDGIDDNSTRKLEELRRLIKGSDVLIYCIPLTPPNSTGSALSMEGLGFLDEISKETGGRLYEPKNTSVVSRIFELIALELGHQYTVGYRPSNFVDDGKEHRIKLTVKPAPDTAGRVAQLTIRTRPTYLANSRLLKRELK